MFIGSHDKTGVGDPDEMRRKVRVLCMDDYLSITYSSEALKIEGGKGGIAVVTRDSIVPSRASCRPTTSGADFLVMNDLDSTSITDGPTTIAALNNVTGLYPDGDDYRSRLDRADLTWVKLGVVRIKDMLNCSRRMFFENAVEGYEYSGRGTGFLCRYQGYDFVVTAGHVVKGFEADSIRVLYCETARDFVPHNAHVAIRADADDRSEDDDWRDLAIFPLERSLYADEQFADQQPYPIPASDYIWRPGMVGHFITRGYLNQPSPVDYDAKVLRQQPVILEADYTGPSPMKLCHEMRFRDLSHCAVFDDPENKLDGMSGAPVFWLGETEPRNHRFAGVAVRATYSSGIGHFVHGSVVLAALEKALAGSQPSDARL